MILVAFVLVLVATVMLIIGTFFDGGVAFIWISIGACVATFGVLAASYFARRRGADDQGARPQPLGAGESRPAASRSAPRATTVGAGGTATATRERTDTEVEPDTEAGGDTGDDEPTVTIVPPAVEGPGDEADEAAEAVPAATGGTADTQEIERVETADEESEPAPRRVAPRRVVRRAPVAAAQTTEDEAAGTTEAPDTTEAPTWPSKDDEEAPAAEAPAAAGGTPRVVRSTEAGTTRKVVRRAAPAGGTRKVVRRTSGSGGTRVVRRAGDAAAVGAGGATGQRTVKRVVRRAPASSDAGADQQPAQKSSPDRSGTRGKRARAVLSEIKGVGPAKQDALLKRFGSLEAMAEASLDDLAEVKGVGDSVATAIKKALKDR